MDKKELIKEMTCSDLTPALLVLSWAFGVVCGLILVFLARI